MFESLMALWDIFNDELAKENDARRLEREAQKRRDRRFLDSWLSDRSPLLESIQDRLDDEESGRKGRRYD